VSTQSARRPVVLFADTGTWQGFLDLAAALRARGVDVARVTVVPRSSSASTAQRIESHIFHRTHAVLPAAVDHEGDRRRRVDALRAALTPDVVDVQITDDLIPVGLELPGTAADPRRLVAADVDPTTLEDKWLQAEVAAASGVRSPRAWETPTASRFPVVVKARTGFGGRGVHIVQDDAELALAWERASTFDGRSPFVQEFHHRGVNANGIAREGQVLVAGYWIPELDPEHPTAPPVGASAVDDRRVRQATEDFVRGVGYTGFFSLNFVLDDEDGAPLLIDFNPRVSGTWALLQELGVDYVSAYLHLIGLGPAPDPGPVRYGEPRRQLVVSSPQAATAAEVLAWRRETLSLVRQRADWLGSRWGRVMRTKVELLAARELVRVVRHGRAAPAPAPATV
jgi:hypothetical protein